MRARTAASHHRVEALADLLDAALTPDRLIGVLTRFHGFWAGTETLVDDWAVANPALAADLAWPRRRRAHLQAQDLLALGAGPGDIAPPPRADLDDAAVLGWFYVAEGSTLGGAVIARRLRPLTGRLGVRLRSFEPYAEGPGPMWRDYGRVLESWTAEDANRMQRVCEAAERTFTALETWLQPLGREVVA